jgi:hypothetical protein
MTPYIPAQTGSKHLSTIPRPLSSAIDTASVMAQLTVAVPQHSSTRSRASPSSCPSPSPFFHGRASGLEEDAEDSHNLPEVDEHRSLLLHTKSALPVSAHVSGPFARIPPRMISPALTLAHLKPGSTLSATSSNTSISTGSSEDLNAMSIPGVDNAACARAKKKYVSFNTFLKQCIAIEKPERKYSCAIL